MLRPRSAACLLGACSLLLSLSPCSLHAQAYAGKPRLVVEIVIDQFRGDYLERYHADLGPGGFRLLLDHGAWFPNCYYNYANTKTAPGHATLGTGAYSDGHGIDSNEWWDAARPQNHPVSSVEDEHYALVGMPTSSANQPGASPLNLRATTLGDELRLATQGRSRVFGVSLKDRASILPSGQAANAAYWMDAQSGHFISSTYYMSALPDWVTAFNNGSAAADARKVAHASADAAFYKAVGGEPEGNAYELDFARQLITHEKLGQDPTTDLITISLSSNDIMGHAHGPDSKEERAMVLGLDHDLAGFFTWLDKTVGLGNVWIALSADHGVAPVPAQAAALGVNAAMVNLKTLENSVNADLNATYSPGSGTHYLLSVMELPYIDLDDHAFAAVHVDEATAEKAVAAAIAKAVRAMDPPTAGVSDHRLPPVPRLLGTFTRTQFQTNQLPDSEFGRQLAHSYADHGHWFVMAVFNGYQMEDITSWGGTTGTTHFSPWNYDRHVPLIFYGSPFAAGTYRERVEPVDLASTFAALLGINQPSAAVGHVLTGALNASTRAPL